MVQRHLSLASMCTCAYEQTYWDKGYVVIGLDEVGRGSLAGPVYVGGVCIDPQDRLVWEQIGIRDSKKLSAKQRERCAKHIRERALCWSVQSSSVSFINVRGIVSAMHDAARRVVADICGRMGARRYFLLSDAYPIPDLTMDQEAVVGGDNISISIAAGAIVAKVMRDAHMSTLHQMHPYYGWDTNKGYGTSAHRQAICMRGVTHHHRTLFVRTAL